MSELPIKFSPEKSQFIQSISNCLYDVNGNDFYFIPFWFEKVGEDTFIQHPLGGLPEQLIQRINRDREPLYDTFDSSIITVNQ